MVVSAELLMTFSAELFNHFAREEDVWVGQVSGCVLLCISWNHGRPAVKIVGTLRYLANSDSIPMRGVFHVMKSKRNYVRSRDPSSP